MPTLVPTTEKRYFTITEVAERLDVNASTLRYWEREFKQLKPRTNARGKRFYIQRDIELIERIHDLVKAQGFTCKGARAVLKSGSKVDAALRAADDATLPLRQPELLPEPPSPLNKEELLGKLEAVRERILALRA